MNNKENINLALRGETKEELKRTEWSEELREFVGGSTPNESIINLLASRSGLDPVKVRINCCTAAGNDADIRRLHEVKEEILKELQEMRAQQNVESEEKNEKGNTETYEDQVASMVNEIREFITPGSEALSKTADITGLTPEQVLTLVNAPSIQADAITLLYSTMADIKEAEMMENEVNRKAM